MSQTLIRGSQVLNGSIQRVDLDTTTTGLAVTTKVVAGSNITIASSGVDPGTGDVTISGVAAFDTGTWTTLTLATGWTVKTTPQYRVENSTGNAIVIARGSITQASGAAALAFTLPSGARPPATRMVMLAGQQTEGQTLYHVQIATTGDVTITPVVRAVFTWPITSTSQDVYLDSLAFSL